MKNTCILLIFSLVLTVTGCNNKQKENALAYETQPDTADGSISNISVLYYNYIVESETPINPIDIQLDIPEFEIDRRGVLDATIDDSTRIESIKLRIDSLRPASQPLPLDARLVATICYKNGKQEVMCLGGKWLDKIFLNGVQQETDNQLLFLLKNYSGFYPWMIGDDMFAMKELQDHSFTKAPFTSTPYYEAYQQALSHR